MRGSALLLAIMVATPSWARGEEIATANPAVDRSRLGVMASYFGETGTHPGLAFGVDYGLLRIGEPHELFARGQLGSYLHPRLYWGAFAGGELGWRSTASFGLRGELALGFAYLHTLLASPVYEVGSDGRARASTDFGRPNVMPSISFGAGWDLGRRTGVPLAVMLRPMVFWQLPVNHAALLHAAGLLSFTYSL